MTRSLSDDELELINSSLESSGRRFRVESKEGKTKVEHLKPQKVKHNRKRLFIFTAGFWGGMFILIPSIVTLAMFSLISRVDAVMGSGALKALSELSSGELKAIGFDEAGLDWIPQLVQVYEARWWILLITWGVCLALAGFLFYIHFRSYKTEAAETRETVKFDLRKEMDELNAAYRPELVDEPVDNKLEEDLNDKD